MNKIKKYAVLITLFFSFSHMLLISNETIEIKEFDTFEEKISYYCGLFLGKPYSGGCLGEGSSAKYDSDPLYRFDSFDCTTFVETIMALAVSADFESFEKNMDLIRYENGEKTYIKRNHFTSGDWVPNNIEAGFLTDITAEIAGDSLKTAKTVIDKKGWYDKKTINDIVMDGLSDEEKEQLAIDIKKEGENLGKADVKLPYLPLDAIFVEKEQKNFTVKKRAAAITKIEKRYKKLIDKTGEDKEKQELTKKMNDEIWDLELEYRISDSELDYDMLNKIPSGTIINIVRPDWNLKKYIGTNLNVSHQGILLREQGKLYLVHASSSDKKVVKVLLTDYLKKYLTSPTVKGINLLKLNNM